MSTLNNNPGNIRRSNTVYVGEVATSENDAFKRFKSMAHGYRAMFVLLRAYRRNRGRDTIHKMIARYAPPSENDTQAYIDTVCKRCKIAPDALVDTQDKDTMTAIVAAMSRVENGKEPNMRDILQGWDIINDK